MIVCPDGLLLDLILRRIAMVQAEKLIVIKNPRKQPKRMARKKRLRRDIRAVDRAIAERCHEIFTP